MHGLLLIFGIALGICTILYFVTGTIGRILNRKYAKFSDTVTTTGRYWFWRITPIEIILTIVTLLLIRFV